MKAAPTSIAAAILLLASAPPAATPAQHEEAPFERAGDVHNETIATPALDSRAGYTLHFSVSPSSAFGDDSRVIVSLSQADTKLVCKTLHAGDSEVLAMFHAAVTGPAKLTVTVESPLVRPARFRLEVLRRGPVKPAAGGTAVAALFPVPLGG